MALRLDSTAPVPGAPPLVGVESHPTPTGRADARWILRDAVAPARGGPCADDGGGPRAARHARSPRVRGGVDRRALHRDVGEHPVSRPVHRQGARPDQDAEARDRRVLPAQPQPAHAGAAHRPARPDGAGRFYWGVGSGGFPGDFELFGVDPKSGEQRGITRAILDLILELWNDPKPGLYESKHWRFRIPEPQEDIGLSLHLRPYQRPHPPIGVAGVSPKSETLVMAGERGYIPMSINFVPARTLRTHWDSVDAGGRRAGRQADRSTWRLARD